VHLEAWQWLVVILCAFGIGLSKGGIAGIGILPIAIFALVLPASASVGIVLPLLICGDIVAVSIFRRHAVWGHLQRLFPWAATGIIGGFLTLYGLQQTHYDPKLVNHQVGRCIGGILILIVLLHVWRSRATSHNDVEANQEAVLVPQNSWQIWGVGIAAGFATMVANASGPILVIYLLAMRLPKMQFIGTAAWFFLILNLFKVPFMYLLNLINAASLTLDLKLAPCVVAGVLTGRQIIGHIDQKLFENIALALTFVAALRMMF